MKPSPGKKTGIGLIPVICLLLGIAPAEPAQKVPISFNDYHGYTAAVEFIKKVAATYPNISELIEIGRSNQDRPIYVLVVSNTKTGTTVDKHVQLRNVRNEPNTQTVVPMKAYQGKPGIWIDGGTHGNEFTGTEVCLYAIDKLVTGYGADAELTRVVDENVFYICPIVNPDGVYNSVEGGISQRQNSAARDEAAPPQAAAAAPRDLNGDGLITQFRYQDPRGRFVLYQEDPRVMVSVAPNETTTRERYSVITEGQARAQEAPREGAPPASRGARGQRGIDVNRNFPEGWFNDSGFQGGSGYYPSSSPEAHAVLEFFTNHTNILQVQSFHTSGGFTYRPYARWPDSRMDPRDLFVFDRVMGKKYLELINEEVPEAWNAPPAQEVQAPPSGRGGQGRQGMGSQGAPARGAAPGAQSRTQAQAARGTGAGRGPEGWRHPYNEEQRTPYGYGVFLDWAYGQFGSFAMSTELWNWQRDSKGLPGYAGENDRSRWESAYIRYQESALGGRAFLPWKPFDYPGIGPGEIGGWVAKYGAGNAIPGESLVALCETHWQFELFKSKMLPRLEISEAKATVLYTTDNAAGARVERQGDTFTITKSKPGGKYRIVQVTATVKNTGALPTHVARGAQLAGNREDAAWLIGDRNRIRFLQGGVWTRLGVLNGTLALPAPPAPAEGAGGGRGRGGGPAAPGQVRRPVPEAPQVQGTGNTREITWLIAIEGDTPLKIVLTSQKGGTVTRDVTIN